MERKLLLTTPLLLVALAGCVTGAAVTGEKSVSKGDMAKISFQIYENNFAYEPGKGIVNGTLIMKTKEPMMFEVHSPSNPSPNEPVRGGINSILLGSQNPKTPDEGPMKERQMRIGRVAPKYAFGEKDEILTCNAIILTGSLTSSLNNTNFSAGDEVTLYDVFSFTSDNPHVEWNFAPPNSSDFIISEIKGNETRLCLKNPHPYAGETVVVILEVHKIYNN